MKKGLRVSPQALDMIGGAEGDRTPDLLHAMQARSQLRHSPNFVLSFFASNLKDLILAIFLSLSSLILVGLSWAGSVRILCKEYSYNSNSS